MEQKNSLTFCLDLSWDNSQISSASASLRFCCCSPSASRLASPVHRFALFVAIIRVPSFGLPQLSVSSHFSKLAHTSIQSFLLKLRSSFIVILWEAMSHILGFAGPGLAEPGMKTPVELASKICCVLPKSVTSLHARHKSVTSENQLANQRTGTYAQERQ